jgi:hypothetical protein
MGIPTMFNGKKTEWRSKVTRVCDECGREFTYYKITSDGLQAKKKCPFCGATIPVRGQNIENSHQSNNG